MNFQTTSVNYLTANGYRMVVRKAPNVAFHLQRVTLPGLSLQSAESSNPFVRVPHTGDHIAYEPLVATCLFNEDMSNYVEVYTWLRQCGFSESHDEWRGLQAKERDMRDRSEISVFLLDSKSRPFIEFTYHDASPVQLSRIDHDTTVTEIAPATATAMFEYTTFSVTRVNEVVPVDSQRWET